MIEIGFELDVVCVLNVEFVHGVVHLTLHAEYLR